MRIKAWLPCMDAGYVFMPTGMPNMHSGRILEGDGLLIVEVFMTLMET